MARSALRSDHIGLREAAEQFGVSVDTLRRRIKDDLLPEAELVAGQFGNTWVVAVDALEAIGEREGWSLAAADTPPLPAPGSEQVAHVQASTYAPEPPSPPAPPLAWASPEADRQNPPEPPDANVVDLRTGAVGLPYGSPDGLTADVLAELISVREAITQAEVRAASAEASVEHLQADGERQASALRRAEADLEYWKSQHDRLAAEAKGEREKRMASDTEVKVGLARIEELRSQHAEDASEMQRLVEDRDAHAQALRIAEGSMGWWSRRRHERLTERT